MEGEPSWKLRQRILDHEKAASISVKTDSVSSSGSNGSETHGSIDEAFGVSATRETVHGLVCCYKETEEELATMLKSFTHGPSIPIDLRLTLVLDGHTKRSDFASSPTFRALTALLDLGNIASDTPPAKGTPDKLSQEDFFPELGCWLFSGKLSCGITPFDLYVKGPTLPRGKRMSQCLFLNEILPKGIARGDWVVPEALYFADADTGHPEEGKNGIFKLYCILMDPDRPNNGAAISQTRPQNTWKNPLTMAQRMSYVASLDYMGGSFYGATATCHGMSNVVKYSCLFAELPDVGKKEGKTLLEGFSAKAENLTEMILLDGAEDTWMALLLRERGFDIACCGISDTVTFVPETLVEYFGQHRRWLAAALLATPLHIIGRNSWFQCRRGRWIFSIYSAWAYLTLLSGLAIAPPVITTCATLVVLWVMGPGRDYSVSGLLSWRDFDDVDGTSQIVWGIYCGIWLFVSLFTAITVDRPPRSMPGAIRCGSWLWLVFATGACLAAVTLYKPIVLPLLMVVPLANVWPSTHPRYWPETVVGIPCFAGMAIIEGVLGFVYTLANLDSREWGTRSVPAYSSNVSQEGDSRLLGWARQQKFIALCLLPASFLLGGAALWLPPWQLYFWLCAVYPGGVMTVRLFVVVLPAGLERLYQLRLLRRSNRKWQQLAVSGRQTPRCPA